jgi:murein DD-endopeptidase MepM/ murein hydrolase activator NlpD
VLRVTRESETQFQELLYELRQEQAYINQQVALLQREIEGKLEASDLLGSSILSWPIDPSIRGISATFHDPTYPFRHLFEHSGLDLPAASGTPVKSAASGYVAWTKQGRLYGNYVMIIHADGMATLYAHLSRIDVVPDQFIARGDQIGTVGSTGLSTGPHLHFETRKNGIPTDPLNYLMPY